MKILITGSNGMLAHALKKVLRPKNRLILTDIQNMDITKFRAVQDFFAKSKPEIVIHTAAYTDVDGAESNKALALKINRDGTKNVAMAAKKLDIPIVYISTDYVFGGDKKRPYNENDRPNPLSVYGTSKYAGEKEVRKVARKHYIVRSAWLYGPSRKNFVATIMRLATESKTLRIVNDQKGCPTYTLDLAKSIAKLIKTNKYGTYHLTNKGPVSWYQFTKEILQIKRIKRQILPITSKVLNRPAKRPKFSVLSNNKAENISIKMRHHKSSLKDYLKEL
jgi:dTDP-4-dehydrorhamnose reductase